MTGSSEENFEPHNTSSLERIVEGGLLRVLAGKPVQVAISRLITGIIEPINAAAEIPTEYLRRISQGIKSDSDARKLLSKKIALSAASEIAANPDLTVRAQQRWIATIEGKQRNIEKIAVNALGILAESPQDQNTELPNDEFLSYFSDIAENVSSPGLIDLLARILAGEIRKSGSISRRTLQITQTIDQRAIEYMLKFIPYISNDGFLLLPSVNFKNWTQDLSLLSSLGIFNEVGMRNISVRENGVGFILIGQRAIMFKRSNISSPRFAFPLLVDGINLTPAGSELISLLPKQPEADLSIFLAHIHGLEPAIEVSIHNFTVEGENMQLSLIEKYQNSKIWSES